VTDLEQRLRRDLREVTERVAPGSIRPLRPPAPRRRTAAARWVAPIAAVAAVIGVITGVSLASHPPGRQAALGTPPYYVIIQDGSSDNPVATAVVRDSATGRVLTRVRFSLGPGGTRSVTAAADDRTFLINEGNALLLLRLAADGRSGRISRLPITVPESVTYVALSPRGNMIAIESQTCRGTQNQCQYSEIRVVSLKTGATKTWSTRAPAGYPMWISWDGGGHVLFTWVPAGTTPSRPSGYRLLNVTGRGGNLLSARVLPLPPLPVYAGYSYPLSAFVTPGGGAVIASTFAVVGSGQNAAVVMKIVEWSPRSGRMLRVLLEGRWHVSLPGVVSETCWVESLGPTGVQALIECPYPRFVFGRWDDGRFTQLPGMSAFPGPEPAAW
jgi:hypothetical protein